jgi:DNA-binding transcriptional LysR family regulator
MLLMPVELRHLRYFVAVAEELHFGRAASRLGISQPPLSQQILALEREIGARLFDRSNRRVELTDAGRLFLADTSGILEQLERAAGVAERVHRGQTGEIRIGFFGSAPFVPEFQQLVFGFRREHPSVNVVLREMTSYRQVDAVLDGELDVAFVRPLQPSPEAVETLEILREPLLAVMRSDHPLAGSEEPLSVSQLSEQPLIGYARSIGSGLYQTVVDLCRNAGFAPVITQEANATPTMMGLVAAGLGISILPASLQSLSFGGVTFRPLRDASAHTAVWLARRRDDSSILPHRFFAMAAKLRRAKPAQKPPPGAAD